MLSSKNKFAPKVSIVDENNSSINKKNGHSNNNHNYSNETSSLLNPSKQSSRVSSSWQFWNPESNSFRFFILALASLVPLGGHVVKYSVAALNTDLTSDKEFNLDHTQFGTFQSAVSVPNVFVPIIGGMLLDVRGSRLGTIVALLLALLGHIVFTYACTVKSYMIAVIGRVIFGMGQGSTVVAQGHICASYFFGYELVFAVAVSECTHNLANWIAMVYVVPATKYFGGNYVAALWVGCGICLFSFFAGCLFYYISPTEASNEIAAEESEIEGLNEQNNMVIQHESQCPLYNSNQPIQHKNNNQTIVMDESSENNNLMTLLTAGRMTVGFLALAILHLVFSNCYHLFAYISADFMVTRFNLDLAEATWLAGLSNGLAIFFCPIAGFFLDRIGFKMYFCFIGGVATAVAYALLAWSTIIPQIPMFILAVCIAFVPTILRSSVPNLVAPALFGTAYGVYEISESIGAVAGHSLVGYVRDKTHSYDSDMMIFIGMALVASALSLFLSCFDSYYGGTLNEPSRLSEKTREIDQKCKCINPQVKRAHAMSIVAIQAPKGYARSASIIEIRRRSLM